MDTSIIEKEYNTVKRSLEAMGYKGILSTESTGLVNRILSDLIKATKAFKNMQTEKEKVSAELKVQGDLVLPLRNENLKLAKENNELHRELIKIRDDLDLRYTSNAVALTKLQNENMELKFLLTQKDNAYKQISIQNESLRNKLNKVFSKMGLPLRSYGSHSFRKYFASRIYLENEMNIELVRVLLQHSSVAVTQRYIGLSQKTVEDALAKTVAHLV